MQRFHPHDEPWGAFVDVKINAVEVLKRQLRRAAPGEVFMSSACDGWQPIEAQCRLTRRCCELLLERGFQLNVLTKSTLVLRDIDLFRGPARAGRHHADHARRAAARTVGAGGGQRRGAVRSDRGGTRGGPEDGRDVRPAAAVPFRQPGVARRFDETGGRSGRRRDLGRCDEPAAASLAGRGRTAAGGVSRAAAAISQDALR